MSRIAYILYARSLLCVNIFFRTASGRLQVALEFGAGTYTVGSLLGRPTNQVVQKTWKRVRLIEKQSQQHALAVRGKYFRGTLRSDVRKSNHVNHTFEKININEYFCKHSIVTLLLRASSLNV